jgi:tRNA-specific 2-thiouridylase
VLGRHDGIIRYTVGQRRGIGIGGRDADSDPLYVVRLEPATRRVVVGPRAALARDRVTLDAVNWLGGDAPKEGTPVQVKLRSTMAPVGATLSGEGGTAVDFDDPQYGVSPGQACVFYDGDRVLGGGWIRREG